MESWRYFIWIKRVAPIVVIGLLLLAYSMYQDHQASVLEETETKIASVTAHIWIASAKYRHNPDRYLEYRDSVLKANDLTLEQMKAFRTRYDETSEQYERVVSMTAAFVESLYRVEDSLRVIKEEPGGEDRRCHYRGGVSDCRPIHDYD
jgi:hypothetical protein